MRLTSPWTPRLAEVKGSPSDRLAAALAEDIADGRIPGGARLPPHRELAYQLGIGVGTVTKAYAVIQRRGLAQSVRGRGMFVAGLSHRFSSVVDLSINTPPQMLSDRLLAATLTGLAKRLDAGTFGAYASPAGRHEHRVQMARWLAAQRLEVPPECVLLCNGAQHALSIAFAVACAAGGVLLTETFTYPGAITLARQAGYPLIGVDMDNEGVSPEALERILHVSAHKAARPILYVTPTLQNPTTATMGLRRRQDIVHICRMHDVTIVEDDVYSIFAKSHLPPLAALAPERTFYVTGLSKALSPGLRIGALAAPPAFVELALSKLQATCTMASPIACMIMEQWLTDGTAASVAASIRSDAAKRSDLVRAALPLSILPSSTASFHAWLPMPVTDAENLARNAAGKGVTVMSPRAPLVDPGALEGGIRLSLGAPPIDVLEQAIATIRRLLDQRHPQCGTAAAL